MYFVCNGILKRKKEQTTDAVSCRRNQRRLINSDKDYPLYFPSTGISKRKKDQMTDALPCRRDQRRWINSDKDNPLYFVCNGILKKKKSGGVGAEPQTNRAVWAYYPLARIVVLISPKSKGKNAWSKEQ